MPIQLQIVNLASAVVGSSGYIDLTQSLGQTGVPSLAKVLGSNGLTPNRPTIRLHNESSSGLSVQLPNSGQSFVLPAGGWQDCYPLPGETQVQYTVLYQLPNPQVTLLIGTYYRPNEDVPRMPILGNSSVGITGSVNTVGNTLVNTSSAPGVADIIEVANTSSGGDITTLDNSGNFVNGNNDYPGTVKFDNDKISSDGSGNWKSNSIITDTIENATTGDTINIKDENGDIIAAMNDQQGTRPTTSGNGSLAADKVWFNVGGIKALNNGTVTTASSITINHGLSGQPSAVWSDCTQSGSTATTSTYGYTSTQFTLLNGSGVSLLFRWIAYR